MRVLGMEQPSISRRAERDFLAHLDSLLQVRATRTAREHRAPMKVPTCRGMRIGGFRNDFSVRAFALGPVAAHFGDVDLRGRDVH